MQAKLLWGLQGGLNEYSMQTVSKDEDLVQTVT